MFGLITNLPVLVTLLTLPALVTPAAITTLPTTPNTPSLPANYTLVPLTWEVKAFPWSAPVLVTGTVEDVIKSMLAINPRYLETMNLTSPNPLDHDNTNTLADDETNSLAARDYFSHYCFGKLDSCSQTHTFMGALYLARLDGQPKAGPGPGQCARVSCSYNSGITWCNHNDREVTLSRWSMIADAAWYIAEHCTRGNKRNFQTAGEIFYTTGWSTMVHGGMKC